MHLPHLIGPMQHYLWILKTTHSGADLDTSLEMAKGGLDGGLQWTLYDILNNRCDIFTTPLYSSLEACTQTISALFSSRVNCKA
jgi:hypothetical protein